MRHPKAILAKVAAATVLVLLATAARPAGAVIIRGGDGSGNISPPADDPGWANVGQVGSASGVYLGNGWVLTAAHVAGNNPSAAYFDGGSYDVVPGSGYRLHDPANNATPVDLELVRLATAPGLPALPLSSRAPNNSTSVIGIGYGKDRAASDTWWDSNWQQTLSGMGAYDGFFYEGSGEKRWGQNQIAASGVLANDGYGDTYMLETIFDNSNSNPNEMQAARGDSGGALFAKNGNSWELAGLILAVSSPRPGQPADTALYGDATFYADLSRYRDQIQAVISSSSSLNEVPEPSTVALLGSLLVLGGWYALRGRRRRGE